MLQNVRLVKLLNFGEKKVHGRLLPNAVTLEDRHQSKLQNSRMMLISPHCERLLTYLREIIHDWGTHLSSHLYNQALIQHFGGENQCVKRMELHSGSRLLGTHPVQFHANGYAFVVSSLSRDQQAYQQHLDALLSHARLNAIQWINFNRSEVEITTLENG